MKPIQINEVLALADYERIRDVIRPMIIREKARRRLAVGSHLTLLFENRQTVWYQVQEMIRTEKISTAAAVAHELETYNELIPHAGELSATMLVEYADARERDAALGRLVGIERHMKIVVGERRFDLSFDERQMSAERVSAVQFVRFALDGISAETFRALASDGRISIEVDHPSLAASAKITGELAQALAEDLA